MNIHYVRNKSKFIDLDAARPRLMNIQTTTKLLESFGISDTHKEILYIMENKIMTIDNKRPQPAVYAALNKWSIAYEMPLFSIQGCKLNLSEALNLLIRREMKMADALRALALAVDIANKKD